MSGTSSGKGDDIYSQAATAVQFAAAVATTQHEQQNRQSCSGHQDGSSAELPRFCGQPLYDVHRELSTFWPRAKAKIEALDSSTLREATRHQELPLARIKKIMKLDDDVKQQMISAEAPVLLAKAAELFIEELTLRAWLHTEESKRKTLQKSDISQAVARDEQFDFLIDIVPRDEATRRISQSSTVQLGRNGSDSEILIGDKVYAPLSQTANATDAGSVQFVFQVATPEGSTLPAGAMLQATQIGQPIQLPPSNGGQPIQVLAVGLPDGGVQHFQVQLPVVPTSTSPSD